MPSEEIKTILTILSHQALVRAYLLNLANQLQQRALLHDLSKFQLDEFEGMVSLNSVARGQRLDSSEYKDTLKEEAIKLHWSRNSHHPEYYRDGIKDMSLLDLIEMMIDWRAASETYKRTSFGESLQIQKERFKMTDEQYHLVQLIAEEIMK